MTVLLYGREVDYDDCVAKMDDEIREDVFADLGSCSAQVFLDAYVERHEEKFDGEMFEV